MKQAGLNSKVSITKDFFQNSLFNFQGPARDIRGIAQLGEHLLCKQGVSGSIPLISTNKNSRGS